MEIEEHTKMVLPFLFNVHRFFEHRKNGDIFGVLTIMEVMSDSNTDKKTLLHDGSSFWLLAMIYMECWGLLAMNRHDSWNQAESGQILIFQYWGLTHLFHCWLLMDE